MDFAQIQQDFERDGGVRELHILGTTAAEWQCVVDLVYAVGRDVRYTLNYEPAPAPPSVDAAFTARQHDAPMLAFYIDAVLFTTHFVTPDEIELIFDPEDIEAQAHLDTLAGFAQQLARITSRTVLVTHEGFPGPVIFQVAPGAAPMTAPAEA